uniref:MADF domain-containing protein n=1 Tax=Heliothis virescens TaxID=7102 RepID=A0A2A4JCK4_HELVI
MSLLNSMCLKTMNFIERLIKEVANRPVLWNRYENDYNNRAVMDQEWDNIAEALDKDKDFVKQKWRNLRDQFQREYKKVKVPFDNPIKPYIHYYRGKWIYFEHMLFLKECELPQQDSEGHDVENIKEEVIEFEDNNMFSNQVDYNNDSDYTEIEASMSSNNEEQESHYVMLPKLEFMDEKSPEGNNENVVDRKRKSIENKGEAQVPVKVKKPSVVDASSNTEEQNDIDDDLHFVKSLVPYFRKLSPIRKLLVRNEIQSLLIRESLCENCKFGNKSTHKC